MIAAATIADYAAEFDRCASWIESALPYCHGNYELVDVRDACLAGRMQLWPGERCAVVTEICHWPRRKGCNAIFGGGDLEEIKRKHDEIEAWAKRIGCDHLTCMGRKGFVRALGVGEIIGVISWKEL